MIATAISQFGQLGKLSTARKREETDLKKTTTTKQTIVPFKVRIVIVKKEFKIWLTSTQKQKSTFELFYVI